MIDGVKTGKYFSIKSHLNNFLMTVIESPEAKKVVMMPRQANDQVPDSQLWYEDHVIKTIKSKVNGYCIQVIGKTLHLAACQGTSAQQWCFYEQHIVRLDDPNEALDILNVNKEAGAEIGKYSRHSQPNQLWTLEYEKAIYFTIQSIQNSKFLGCEDGSIGSKIKTYDSHRDDRQLWFEDKFGVVHFKLNSMAMDTRSGSVRLQHYDPSSFYQQYIISDNCLANKHDQDSVLHINILNGEETLVSDKGRNKDSGRWRFVELQGQLTTENQSVLI